MTRQNKQHAPALISTYIAEHRDGTSVHHLHISTNQRIIDVVIVENYCRNGFMFTVNMPKSNVFRRIIVGLLLGTVMD